MAVLKDPEELEKDLPDSEDDSEPEQPEVEVSEPQEPDAEVHVPIAQPNRKERRANRVKEFEERARQAERERDEYRSRITQLEQRAPQQGNPQQAQANRHEVALHQVYNEIERLHQEYNVASSRSGFSDADRKPYEERARRLDMQKHAIIADARQPQLDVQQLVRHVQWKAFESEHSDVFGNEQVKNWAWAEYNKRKAEGHAETRELALETLDKARVRFGMQPRSGRGSIPDQATRQRLSGVRSSAGGGGGGGDPIVKMGRHERRLAVTLYPDMPEKEAWQKWANGPGKRLLSKQK
jgi:hypothetical protein